jgi:hypothetical protein
MCRAATVLRLRVVLHPRIGSVSRQLGSSVTDLPGPARSSPSARQRPHRTVPMHRSRPGRPRSRASPPPLLTS